MSFAKLTQRNAVVPLVGSDGQLPRRQKKALPAPETKHQQRNGIARKKIVDKEAHEKEVLRSRMEQSLKFRAPPVSTRPPSPPVELTPAQKLKLKQQGPERVNPALVAPRVYVPLKASNDDLVSPLKINDKSGLFADEKTRFQSEKAEDLLRVERQTRTSKKAHVLTKKAEEMQRRDDDRYRRMEEEKAAAKEQEQKLRDSGKAQRNVGSMPYNPITLAYADGLDGARLKHHDDSQRYRAQMRQINLQQRMTGSHNPITGEPQRHLNAPPRPKTPADVKAARAKVAAAKHKSQSQWDEMMGGDQSALPQRRYGRRPNPFLDADGLASKYGAHHELYLQRQRDKQHQQQQPAAPIASAAPPAPSPAAPAAAASNSNSSAAAAAPPLAQAASPAAAKP